MSTDCKESKYNDDTNKTGARRNNGAAGNRAAWYDSSPEDGNRVVCDGWWEGAEPEDAMVAQVDAAVAVLAAADVVVAPADAMVADVQAALPDVAVVVFVVVGAVAVVVAVDGIELKQTNRESA